MSDRPSQRGALGASLLPRRVFLADKPEVTVARPTLGLVVFLDDPEAWAREHAARVCERLVELVGPASFRAFMTSALDRWRPIGPGDVSEVVEQLRIDLYSPRLRHLLLFRMVNDVGAPSVEFTYREVDPGRSRRLGYLRISLPADHPPDELLALAIELGQTTPIWSGLGGWMLSANPLYVREASEWALRWTRRCLGLHVAFPEELARAGREALTGVGWLNLLGPGAVEALGLDLGALERQRWRGDVALMRLRQGALLRAGVAPELGDSNALEFPEALAEVARALEPYLPAALPPLPPPFGEVAEDWLHRFSAPERWS